MTRNDKVSGINVFGIGFALGVVWGCSMLLLGWFAIAGWGTYFVEVMSSIYIGYYPSFGGAILGGIWGFFHAAIVGGIFAVIYNIFVSKKSGKHISLHTSILYGGE